MKPDRPVADGRSTRWDEHRARRRDALVEATIAAVRTYGAGVGMDEVAAQAGTSKTVVYRHFADRTDLHRAVCAHVAGVLITQIRGSAGAPGRPRDRIAAGIDTYLRLIEQDPELYRFVVHRGPVDDAVTDLVTLIGNDVARAIEAIHPGSAAVPWGHGIVGLVRGAADHWLAHPGRLSRAELGAHLTDLVWNGLSGLSKGRS